MKQITTTIGEQYTYLPNTNWAPAPQGWQCPVCRRIYSPMITFCPVCSPQQQNVYPTYIWAVT